MVSDRIPVVVLCGAHGAGKTRWIQHVLAHQSPKDHTAHPVLDSGAVWLIVSPHRWMSLPVGFLHCSVPVMAPVLDEDCACCGIQGALVEALRSAFMQSLQRRIPRIAGVLIELSAFDEPALVISTVRYERFLAERFEYAGAVVVVRPECPVAQELAVVSRQIVVAQAIVLNTLSSHPLRLPAWCPLLPHPLPVHAITWRPLLHQLVECLREQVRRMRSPRALFPVQGRASGPVVSNKAALSPVSALSNPCQSLSYVTWFERTWDTPVKRSALYRLLEALAQRSDHAVLRVSGWVSLAGASGVFEVGVVHRQVYPLQPLEIGFDEGYAPCGLTFVVLREHAQCIAALVHDLLP